MFKIFNNCLVNSNYGSLTSCADMTLKVLPEIHPSNPLEGGLNDTIKNKVSYYIKDSEAWLTEVKEKLLKEQNFPVDLLADIENQVPSLWDQAKGLITDRKNEKTWTNYFLNSSLSLIDVNIVKYLILNIVSSIIGNYKIKPNENIIKVLLNRVGGGESVEIIQKQWDELTLKEKNCHQNLKNIDSLIKNLSTSDKKEKLKLESQKSDILIMLKALENDKKNLFKIVSKNLLKTAFPNGPNDILLPKYVNFGFIKSLLFYFADGESKLSDILFNLWNTKEKNKIEAAAGYEQDDEHSKNITDFTGGCGLENLMDYVEKNVSVYVKKALNLNISDSLKQIINGFLGDHETKLLSGLSSELIKPILIHVFLNLSKDQKNDSTHILTYAAEKIINMIHNFARENAGTLDSSQDLRENLFPLVKQIMEEAGLTDKAKFAGYGTIIEILEESLYQFAADFFKNVIERTKNYDPLVGKFNAAESKAARSLAEKIVHKVDVNLQASILNFLEKNSIDEKILQPLIVNGEGPVISPDFFKQSIQEFVEGKTFNIIKPYFLNWLKQTILIILSNFSSTKEDCIASAFSNLMHSIQNNGQPLFSETELANYSGMSKEEKEVLHSRFNPLVEELLAKGGYAGAMPNMLLPDFLKKPLLDHLLKPLMAEKFFELYQDLFSPSINPIEALYVPEISSQLADEAIPLIKQYLASAGIPLVSLLDEGLGGKKLDAFDHVVLSKNLLSIIEQSQNLQVWDNFKMWLTNIFGHGLNNLAKGNLQVGDPISTLMLNLVTSLQGAELDAQFSGNLEIYAALKLKLVNKEKELEDLRERALLEPLIAPLKKINKELQELLASSPGNSAGIAKKKAELEIAKNSIIFKSKILAPIAELEKELSALADTEKEKIALKKSAIIHAWETILLQKPISSGAIDSCARDLQNINYMFNTVKLPRLKTSPHFKSLFTAAVTPPDMTFNELEDSLLSKLQPYASSLMQKMDLNNPQHIPNIPALLKDILWLSPDNKDPRAVPFLEQKLLPKLLLKTYVDMTNTHRARHQFLDTLRQEGIVLELRNEQKQVYKKNVADLAEEASHHYAKFALKKGLNHILTNAGDIADGLYSKFGLNPIYPKDAPGLDPSVCKALGDFGRSDLAPHTILAEEMENEVAGVALMLFSNATANLRKMEANNPKLSYQILMEFIKIANSYLSKANELSRETGFKRIHKIDKDVVREKFAEDRALSHPAVDYERNSAIDREQKELIELETSLKRMASQLVKTSEKFKRNKANFDDLKAKITQTKQDLAELEKIEKNATQDSNFHSIALSKNKQLQRLEKSAQWYIDLEDSTIDMKDQIVKINLQMVKLRESIQAKQNEAKEQEILEFYKPLADLLISIALPNGPEDIKLPGAGEIWELLNTHGGTLAYQIFHVVGEEKMLNKNLVVVLETINEMITEEADLPVKIEEIEANIQRQQLIINHPKSTTEARQKAEQQIQAYREQLDYIIKPKNIKPSIKEEKIKILAQLERRIGKVVNLLEDPKQRDGLLKKLEANQEYKPLVDAYREIIELEKEEEIFNEFIKNIETSVSPLILGTLASLKFLARKKEYVTKDKLFPILRATMEDQPLSKILAKGFITGAQSLSSQKEKLPLSKKEVAQAKIQEQRDFEKNISEFKEQVGKPFESLRKQVEGSIENKFLVFGALIKWLAKPFTLAAFRIVAYIAKWISHDIRLDLTKFEPNASLAYQGLTSAAGIIRQNWKKVKNKPKQNLNWEG